MCSKGQWFSAKAALTDDLCIRASTSDEIISEHFIFIIFNFI